MKKNTQKGFMLVETLVVTTFISGVFIFLFIQFNNLNKSYKNSFKYDTVEGKYALEDIVNYIKFDISFKANLNSYINTSKFIILNNCDENLFSNVNYCEKLFELEEIEEAIIVNSGFEVSENDKISENIKEYLNKVKKDNSNNLDYLIIIQLSNGSVTSKYINI